VVVVMVCGSGNGKRGGKGNETEMREKASANLHQCDDNHKVELIQYEV